MRFPNKNFEYILNAAMNATYPVHLNFLDYITGTKYEPPH
jgi:hypothetical protein